VINLTPDLILHRVPDIRVHIDSSNNISILSDDKSYRLGPQGLTVLDIFHQPTSVSEALEKLSTRITGAQDWIALTTSIVQLYEAGILQDGTQRGLKLEPGALNFGAPDIHVKMLNDWVRTSSFLTGITEIVSPGDVVVDIGTGTGVLAIAAARAGAEHVYAIEASAIGEVAKAVFEANGLADRITLLKGWSTQIDLPERASVLVSEIIGNEPLGENVLEITADAQKRLLEPDARMIPSKVRILGLPVTIPYIELMKHSPTPESLQSWRSWYGIEFDPFYEAAQDSSPAFFIKPYKASSWKVLSEPILMAEVDLGRVEQISIDNSVTVAADTSGQLNGLLVYFELELGPTTRLSTHPAQADKSSSWRSMVWILDPLSLQVGDRFNVTYQYRTTRTPHRVAITRA
jgi:predicted RNA methylase